jgi:hypothetical protein
VSIGPEPVVWTPLPRPAPVRPVLQKDKLAVAGFVFGIISVLSDVLHVIPFSSLLSFIWWPLCLVPLAALLAVTFSWCGHTRTRKLGTRGGRLAQIGLALGVLGLSWSVAVRVWFLL